MRKKSGSIFFAICVCAMALTATSCAERSLIRKIDGAISSLQSVTITTDDQPTRIMDCVYGFGSKFVMLDSVTQDRLQALGHLESSALAGFAVSDELGPYFAVDPKEKRGNNSRDQYLAMLVDSGADINTGFITPSGEEESMRSFVRRAVFSIDPARFKETRDPVQGLDGNELGWTLMMLGKVDMADAEWRYSRGRTGSARLAEIAASRPLDWGAYSGLIEQQGIATVLREHKKIRLIEATGYYNAEKKKNRGKAGDPPLYDSVSISKKWQFAEKHVSEVVKTLKKYRNDDGTFSRKWSSAKKTEGNDMDVILYTSLAVEVLSEALPDNQLMEPWVVESVERLARLATDNRFELHDNSRVMSHAARALRKYRDRLKAKNQPVVVNEEISEAGKSDAEK